ncbi:MAG: hypothetical protein ABSF37_04165 [Sedimentisphaerales bacterium]|jgi:hypothetical protein
MRNEKKRDAGPKYLALTFFQKGIVSLYEKTFSFDPALFWESRSSCFGPQLSSVSTPFGEASRTPKTERGILSIKIYVLFSAGQNG